MSPGGSGPARPGARGPFGALADLVGSSRTALALLLLLAALVLAGSVLPQESILGPATVDAWCRERPSLGAAARALGLFHVFRTPVFLAAIALLFLNTATCTILRFVREGGVAGVRAGGTIRRSGFYVLHLGLLLLMAGGFWSYAAASDGMAYLTEGQVFRESRDPPSPGPSPGPCGVCGLAPGVHAPYRTLHVGPLGAGRDLGCEVRLDRVDVTLVDGRHRTDVASRMSVMKDGRVLREGVARFNAPFGVGGFSFVPVQTGFAPRIWIRRRGTAVPLGAAFVTLSTDEGPGLRRFHDELPMDFLPNRTVITLLPTWERRDGAARCTGEDLTEPLLVVETFGPDGGPLERVEAGRGEWKAVGDLEFRFTDVRRWSSFRVASDPGYAASLLALVLCLAGMLLRYAPDLAEWLGPGAADRAGGGDGGAA